LVTPDVQVRIRPKISLDNLFHLLGVGESWQVESTLGAYALEDEPLSVAVVRLLCREIERISVRGLLHGYVGREERLLTVRGRIDFAATMRRPWERSPVPCRYDDFVPDVFVNRALLSSMFVGRQLPELPPLVRGELHLLMARFEGVTPVAMTADEIDRWRPSRSDRRYEPALRLASIVIRRTELADRAGAAKAASFTIDMNQLFEEFVGRELRRRMPAGLELVEQYPAKLDRAGWMSMRPDFVLHPIGRPRSPIYVADTKYKLTESLGTISDHYQLLAYATVFGLDEGVLIYCQRPDDDAPLEELPVRHVDIAGSRVRTIVYRLDLSGGRADIARSVDRLADYLVARSSQSSAAARPIKRREASISDSRSLSTTS
jgi:5-methylcytosine-specific restriction enzyme subunit McrC